MFCTFLEVLDLVAAELPLPFTFGAAPAPAAGPRGRVIAAARAAQQGNAATAGGAVHLTSADMADREVTFARFRDDYLPKNTGLPMRGRLNKVSPAPCSGHRTFASG